MSEQAQKNTNSMILRFLTRTKSTCNWRTMQSRSLTKSMESMRKEISQVLIRFSVTSLRLS